MYGKNCGWFCLPPKALKRTGVALAVTGGVLIVAFVPFRYWMVLIGLVLLMAGTALMAMS